MRSMLAIGVLILFVSAFQAHAAEASAPTEGATPVAAPSGDVAKPAEPATPTPTMLIVPTGNAKLGLLLQYWLVNDSTGTNLNNRLRRAEIKLAGSVAENTRWFVMVDPAKTMRTGAIAQTNDNKILQDLGIGFSVCPEIEVLFGQFKTPTTAEGLDSTSELLFVERAYFARTFGDRREPGVM
ncbi:MAG: porin, partial [Bdellovibrionota bacterium]